MSENASGGPDKAAGSKPTPLYPDGFYVEFTVEKGKSTKSGKDYTTIVMSTPRGALTALRVDEWSLIHDILPAGNPIKAALGKAIVDRISAGGGKPVETVSKGRVTL